MPHPYSHGSALKEEEEEKEAAAAAASENPVGAPSALLVDQILEQWRLCSTAGADPGAPAATALTCLPLLRIHLCVVRAKEWMKNTRVNDGLVAGQPWFAEPSSNSPPTAPTPTPAPFKRTVRRGVVRGLQLLCGLVASVSGQLCARYLWRAQAESDAAVAAGCGVPRCVLSAVASTTEDRRSQRGARWITPTSRPGGWCGNSSRHGRRRRSHRRPPRPRLPSPLCSHSSGGARQRAWASYAAPAKTSWRCCTASIEVMPTADEGLRAKSQCSSACGPPPWALHGYAALFAAHWGARRRPGSFRVRSGRNGSNDSVDAPPARHLLRGSVLW